jgi:DNA-binding transcriptional LysR family regulator
MDDLELRELRYFIAVAEELNFTRAAMRLGMAQPPLSAAIGKLERKLGVTLLERTSRRVTLTPAGAVLLEQGRIAVEAAGAAAERARRQGTQPGRLTVAVKPGTGTGLLKRIMERCAAEPLIPQVHVLFGHPGGPAAAVRAGAADAAILRAPTWPASPCRTGPGRPTRPPPPTGPAPTRQDPRPGTTPPGITPPGTTRPAPRSTTSVSCWTP